MRALALLGLAALAVAGVRAVPAQALDGEGALREAVARWLDRYPSFRTQCALDVAGPESGFDPYASNGTHWGWFQFGDGETTIWSLSRDWLDQHLEPWQVDPAEHVRVFMAILLEYPRQAALAWSLPASCG